MVYILMYKFCVLVKHHLKTSPAIIIIPLSVYQFISNISPLKQYIFWDGVNHLNDYNKTSLLGNKIILFHSGRGHHDCRVKKRHLVLMRIITDKSKSTYFHDCLLLFPAAHRNRMPEVFPQKNIRQKPGKLLKA